MWEILIILRLRLANGCWPDDRGSIPGRGKISPQRPHRLWTPTHPPAISPWG
jgi:hypothetical protein